MDECSPQEAALNCLRDIERILVPSGFATGPVTEQSRRAMLSASGRETWVRVFVLGVRDGRLEVVIQTSTPPTGDVEIGWLPAEQGRPNLLMRVAGTFPVPGEAWRLVLDPVAIAKV